LREAEDCGTSPAEITERLWPERAGMPAPGWEVRTERRSRAHWPAGRLWSRRAVT